jgi:hypothetical protein
MKKVTGNRRYERELWTQAQHLRNMQPKFSVVYNGGGRERRQPLQRRVLNQSFRALIN